MKHPTAYERTMGHAHCREGSLRRLAIHESPRDAQQLTRQTTMRSQKIDCSVTAVIDTEVCSMGRCVEESASSAGETTERFFSPILMLVANAMSARKYAAAAKVANVALSVLSLGMGPASC